MPILEKIKMDLTLILLISILAVFVIYLFFGINIVRPTQRGLIETLGKYTKFKNPGFAFVFPIFQRIVKVNITERMSDIEPQEIITSDNLNAKVDLVVYYRVKEDEQSVKNSVYKVNSLSYQLETIARTTARNVIGTMPFQDVNSKRKDINRKLQEILVVETKNWGVEVLKVELKEINPPKDVQETMNTVIKAQNTKVAAMDFATARETEADGIKRAKIKEAEGLKQYNILDAEGKSKAFDLINKSFKGNAKELKRLDVTQASLQNNSKIILTEKGINPQIIIGNIPVEREK